ncbi:ABC transporter substrate-binding protein [Pseudonocardia acaciae]|uniref:ABC transporter substrate-binding protein n=1 Tax=Pseudonocardia acaciae TaxID=551276 RepID=UPI00048FBFDD|nr:ABC transporter substrate-binding protein [Pseudonocardia acaciae]
MRTTRALLAVLCLLVAGCGAFGDRPSAPSGPGGGTTIRLGLPTGVTSFANADIVVAQQKGFLAEAGLSVQTQNLRSGVSVAQGVVGGALDVGAASIEPVVNATAAGGDVAIIGAYTDRLAVSAVTPSTIRTPADLRGRRVGVQEVGAFREVMSRLVLKSGGLTPRDVEYVPVDAQNYTAALVDGRIQSAILQTEQGIAAVRQNPNLHVLANLADIVPTYHYGTYFVSRPWLERNRDTATRLLTALTRAHRFMYENKAETVRIVAGATTFGEDVISAAYDELLGRQGVFPVNTGLDRERIEATVATMRGLGILEHDPPPYERLVDSGPVTAAVSTLGERRGDPRWR